MLPIVMAPKTTEMAAPISEEFTPGRPKTK
jgi:hypothetical protein